MGPTKTYKSGLKSLHKIKWDSKLGGNCKYFDTFSSPGKIHFEARIEPVGDPSMRVDWFINGRPLPASSRATTTFKFGFISLDLLSIVLHDSGEYTVRVTNNSGSAESTALLSVQGKW